MLIECELQYMEHQRRRKRGGRRLKSRHGSRISVRTKQGERQRSGQAAEKEGRGAEGGGWRGRCQEGQGKQPPPSSSSSYGHVFCFPTITQPLRHDSWNVCPHLSVNSGSVLVTTPPTPRLLLLLLRQQRSAAASDPAAEPWPPLPPPPAPRALPDKGSQQTRESARALEVQKFKHSSSFFFFFQVTTIW